MMNVREYFESLMNVMGIDKMFDLEEKLYEMYDKNYEGFVSYMKKNNVDLEVIDEKTNEKVLTLWVWDMCDD